MNFNDNPITFNKFLKTTKPFLLKGIQHNHSADVIRKFRGLHTLDSLCDYGRDLSDSLLKAMNCENWQLVMYEPVEFEE